ncbi:MAG: alpha-amylase family glycosyl hydrolase [Spirochaetaceae bacterium]|nr:alpha-amylase family glycosyl hydrolase [Spirochaetaceae bacterium]
MTVPRRLEANIRQVYGRRADRTLAELQELWKRHRLAVAAPEAGAGAGTGPGAARVPEAGDVALIAYADSIRGAGGAPLAALRRFVRRYLAGGSINTLHLLPFFPWDTDRGFSVQDYRAVDPRNGTWADIEALAGEFAHLMADLVINHASLDNPLVQGALTGDPRYRDYVIRYDDGEQPDAAALAALTRPRPDPVLTRYFLVAAGGHMRATFDSPAKEGAPDDEAPIRADGWVWTTFSRPPNPDGSAATRQVDLNFRNPRVLLEMLEVLLCYRGHGADWVRLDAAGYMWKELGTPSIHHPNTHRLLQVMRDALAGRADLVSVAEVNEPQETILPYLGSPDAGVESDLVYQFGHFPLAVHALLSGDASHYKRWLGTLEPFAGRQFITIYGSHDGMGRKPVLGLLPDADLERMVQDLVAGHGALPNYARQAGGGRIIYELCATPWSLINRADAGEPPQLQVDRYVACGALGLVLRGVPAFYINGLLGVPNRLDPEQLDENRSINREQFDEAALYAELDDRGSQMRRVLDRLLHLIEIRAGEPAFDPGGPPLQVLDSPAAVVAVAADGRGRRVVALTNLSAEPQRLRLSTALFRGQGRVRELISGAERTVPAEEAWDMLLAPHDVTWLAGTR